MKMMVGGHTNQLPLPAHNALILRLRERLRKQLLEIATLQRQLAAATRVAPPAASPPYAFGPLPATRPAQEAEISVLTTQIRTNGELIALLRDAIARHTP